MINFDKSSIIFSPNTPSRFVRLMRKPIGVKNRTKVGSYLGCPMDIDGRSSSKFTSILERINSKIGSWKFCNMSPSGKLLLINNVLIALASHILSLYICPVLVLRKISSTLLKFWWANSPSRKPIYWRKKELIFTHKSQGGLGIRDVESLNKSLVAKQC